MTGVTPHSRLIPSQVGNHLGGTAESYSTHLWDNPEKPIEVEFLVNGKVACLSVNLVLAPVLECFLVCFCHLPYVSSFFMGAPLMENSATRVVGAHKNYQRCSYTGEFLSSWKGEFLSEVPSENVSSLCRYGIRTYSRLTLLLCSMKIGCTGIGLCIEVTKSRFKKRRNYRIPVLE